MPSKLQVHLFSSIIMLILRELLMLANNLQFARPLAIATQPRSIPSSIECLSMLIHFADYTQEQEHQASMQDLLVQFQLSSL